MKITTRTVAIILAALFIGIGIISAFPAIANAAETGKAFLISVEAPLTACASDEISVAISVKSITATNGLVALDVALQYDAALLTPKYLTDTELMKNIFASASGNVSSRWEDAGSRLDQSAGKYYIRICDKDATSQFGIKADGILTLKLDFTVNSNAKVGSALTFKVENPYGTDPGDASWKGFEDVYGLGASATTQIVSEIPVTEKLALKSDDKIHSIVKSLVLGFAEDVSAEKMAAAFIGTVKFVDADGKDADVSKAVGTGYSVQLLGTDGKAVDTAVIIIAGDTDGNGIVNATDYLQIKRHFLKTSTLEGNYLIAGDTDSNGAIESTDYIQIKRHFLKTYNLFS